MTPRRIAFFGAGGDYSETVLRRLLREPECRVVLVVTPNVARRGLRGILLRLRVARATRPLRALARRNGIPSARFSPALRPDADVIVVAAFPHLLRAPLRESVPLGAVNVHPSLLPVHRGVDPIFWTFFCDDRETGVSIHKIDDGVDSGPIIAQTRFSIPRGMSEGALIHELAMRGGDLLADSLADLDRSGTAQSESAATVEPLPVPGSWEIDWRTWTAERLWHFLRGVGARGLTIRDRNGRLVIVGEAISFDNRTAAVAAGTVRGRRITTIDGTVLVRRPPLRLLRLARAIAKRLALTSGHVSRTKRATP